MEGITRMGKNREIILMVFDKEDAESLVGATGRKISKGKIIEPDGKPAKCCICDKEMTVGHLGRVAPGSLKLYCDNQICFNDFSVDVI